MELGQVVRILVLDLRKYFNCRYICTFVFCELYTNLYKDSFWLPEDKPHKPNSMTMIKTYHIFHQINNKQNQGQRWRWTAFYATELIRKLCILTFSDFQY